MLPNFIICGTQKGGTTTLYHFLRSHPEIYMPHVKEIHFFDLNFHKGIEWYKKFFTYSKYKSYKAIGEATPLYMYLREVPERIHYYLPSVKLIFILRHPVDRAYSHYWHEISLGYEYLSFRNAILCEQKRLKTGHIFNLQHYSYLDRGKYIEQLRRFLKYFSRDQILIVFNKELKITPVLVMKRIFEFLEVNTKHVDPMWFRKRYNVGRSPRSWYLQRLYYKLKTRNGNTWLTKAICKLNLRKGYPLLDLDTRRRLINFFKTYNEELELFLNKKLPWWYK